MVFLKVACAPLLARHALFLFALLCASSLVRADDLREADRLLHSGQHVQALEQINKVLAAKPRDTHARFLKGTILAEQGSSKEAVEIFLKLTQDHPELPEPYNNLAVLYAAQGLYGKARAALEQSLRTHPSYATAYENLSDVYAKLANQAYDKALRLDSGTPAPKNNKLALLHDLAPVTARAARPVAVVAAASTTKVDAPPQAGSDGGAVPQQRTAISRLPQQDVPPAKPIAAEVKPTIPLASPQAEQSPQVEILETVRAWAAAWSKKDAKAYLSFYAAAFKTPKGESRIKWEQVRRSRILGPRSISVTVASPRIELRSETSARIRFRQGYHSDVFNGNSTKTLLLLKHDGRWLIAEESVN